MMRFEGNGNPVGQFGYSRTIGSRRQRALLIGVILLPTAFLWGCTGMVSGQSAQPPGLYSISGAISPVAGGSGATVTLSGTASATTMANASGNYTFTGLANGSYAITPSQTGYAFSPTSQSETVNGANISGVNFTATAQQAHSVSLSWFASSSPVAGYNVYRTTVSGAQYAKVNSLLVSGLAYTDTTVQSGTLYYYVTTAVDASGNESTYSNQASANVP